MSADNVVVEFGNLLACIEDASLPFAAVADSSSALGVELH